LARLGFTFQSAAAPVSDLVQGTCRRIRGTWALRM